MVFFFTFYALLVQVNSLCSFDGVDFFNFFARTEEVCYVDEKNRQSNIRVIKVKGRGYILS